MKYALFASIVLNLILGYMVWTDRFRFTKVIQEYEDSLKTTTNNGSENIKKAAYNPKEFRN